MAGQPGRRILMRCRKCSRHRYELPWIVRQYERRQSTTIVVDWDADEAIHTCRECAASDLGKANSHLLTPTVSNRVPLTCVTCGSDYESVASEAEERRTCSHWCSAIQKRKWRPWNPLQVRCLKEMARTKSPLTQFAQAVGIKEAMLGGWFRIEGRAISRAYLERIATYLGISVEQAIAEAGGITAEDGRSARGRARGEAFHTQAGTEASRRRLRPAQEAARRANHGRKQSPEAVPRWSRRSLGPLAPARDSGPTGRGTPRRRLRCCC
jgi:hypothetical protein